MADLLLVEDDPRIAELCAWFLERRGHAVRRAESYSAAREEIARARPELMLADLDLGRETGREELPRLAAEGLLPPTMVVSGYLDAALEAELVRLGPVVGTLSKPYEPEELVRRVDEALGRPIEAAEPAAAPDGGWHDEDDEGWTVIGGGGS